MVPSHRPDEQDDFYTGTALGEFLDDFVKAYQFFVRDVPREKRKSDLEIEEQRSQLRRVLSWHFGTVNRMTLNRNRFRSIG